MALRGGAGGINDVITMTKVMLVGKRNRNYIDKHTRPLNKMLKVNIQVKFISQT